MRGKLAKSDWKQMHRGMGLVVLWGLFLLLFGLGYHGHAAKNTEVPTRLPAYRNTQPGVAYVGSKACASCHRKIYDEYIRTDEGSCLIPANAPSQLEKVPALITVYNNKLDRYFQVFHKGSALYQSEYALDAGGHKVFRDVHRLAYASGPGRIGITYFVWRGNYLFEAPLSYYSADKQWHLSPGYQVGDIGFSNPIRPGCIECHAGLPQFVPHRGGLFSNPPFQFQQLSVGCENCHGPGQLHVDKWERGKGMKKGRRNVHISARIDTTIVNPDRLPAWLSNEICMNCHQRADARVLQPGKSFHDIRPGVPLVHDLALLNIPRGATEIPHGYMTIENYTDMEFSKCNLESGGKLRCTDCHDPHYQPSASEAPRYFRKKCLKCHTEHSCGLSLSVRKGKNHNNCYACHMLPGITYRIPHATFTHHRIVAYKGEPYPEIAFHQKTPGLDDLILLDAIPGRGGASLSPLTLLVAYGQLMRSHPKYRKPFLILLSKLAKTEPNNMLVLEALATKEATEGTPEGDRQAIRHLSRAIDMGESSVRTFEMLATLLGQSHRYQEAVQILKRGIKLNPYSAILYKGLAFYLLKLKQYDQALRTLKQELAVYPEDSAMRTLLKKVTSGQ